MAVSKQHPVELLADAAKIGVRLFGENRVQEFAAKKPSLAGLDIEVQMIGHLQSNKLRAAAELFDGVQSVDSLRVAEGLNEASARLNKRLACWIEIKLSDEAAKTGLAPDSTELNGLLERLCEYKALDFRGLMTIPKWSEDPEAPRHTFGQLRDLRDQVAQRYPRLALHELSMGMSHDFETAIEEGATLVRVGTDIFGPRRKT